LTDCFDDGLAEGGNVVGFAAEDELPVGDYFLIDPVGPGVSQVGFQRRPRCHRLALERACLEQRPRTVADCRYCFSG
jgi:hypothetical protein